MSHLFEMGESSIVTMKYKFQSGEVEKKTVILSKTEDRYGRGVLCKNLMHNGTILNCTTGLSSVTVFDVITNREYVFRDARAINLPDRERLVIYSELDVNPKNNRSAYRVSCGMICEIRIGDNCGVISGTVKDISYTGLGCIIIPSNYRINQGDKASCSIFTKGGSVIRAFGTVVRNDINSEKTRIVGIQFDEQYIGVQKLVALLQQLELSHRPSKLQ